MLGTSCFGVKAVCKETTNRYSHSLEVLLFGTQGIIW
jgi:hypothetical protein